ncbi:Crp/Fnr family transcriptional regulator [Flavobacterium sp. CBA20B-1]|uniref:Crp/Fnr family transcriptional regulator n=1 Tax=unclassified Flavobacterium TaxID=196869 RepID=UPI0022245EBB|nr:MULTISPECIES: Crp/Fnr family transcriptional regulator [unclassified Flavobacterium]WCM43415.1 Crp/Fnr family transcriptional regulator [Flavobacterium sp. CBA20B-1]
MKTADLYSLFETNNLFTKELHLNRNEYLSTSGTIDTDIYFIKEGSLKVYVINNGEEQIIRFGYQNNIIVSLDSFLSGKPSDFYIQAIKKSIVKVISKADIMAFLNSDPIYLKLWIAILEDLVLQQIEREKDLLITLPKERYERILKRSPQLFQEIPNKHIANYLRMTPETLSRLKKS